MVSIDQSYLLTSDSDSVYDISSPEVTGLECKFVYNYYVKDERHPASEYNSPVTQNTLDKIPRYVEIKWILPELTTSQSSVSDSRLKVNDGNDIRSHEANLVSEDDMTFYITDYSTDTSVIDVGKVDLENYNYILGTGAESLTKMSSELIYRHVGDRMGITTDGTSVQMPSDKSTIGEYLTYSYRDLSDSPNEGLGLSFYDANGKDVGTTDATKMKEIRDSLSFKTKFSSYVVNDIYANSKKVKRNPGSFDTITRASSLAATKKSTSNISTRPVKYHGTLQSVYPIQVMGYKIERFLCKSNGEKVSDAVFYIEDPTKSSFIDTSVSYGENYLYSVTTVTRITIYVERSLDNQAGPHVPAEIYVASKPVIDNVECFEYSPPPPPADMFFHYDRYKLNLVINWSMPSNPQRDITQFQVFRRKTIREPFELIAQFNFDKSTPGGELNSRYTTGEYVDSNNLYIDRTWTNYLVAESDAPVFMYIDPDFAVDTEFYQSQSYIYALCSVDAHGMISNYSSQYYVEFDPYKNELNTSIICAEGCPKQYPNLLLQSDAFKDSIRVSGTNSKKLTVALTPEYFSLSEKKEKYRNNSDEMSIKILETATPGRRDDPHYLIQIINLDNQKLETLKVTVRDPLSLSNK
jgi:hypothetical protein